MADVQTRDLQQSTMSIFSTFGPTKNEVSTSYATGDMAHTILFYNHISPDIILVFQSQMAGFVRVTGSNKAIDPTPRDVKDVMLLDSNITM